MNMSDRRFFYCYSSQLYTYLRNSGFRYNCRGLHPDTKALFHQFDYTEELVEALVNYSFNI